MRGTPYRMIMTQRLLVVDDEQPLADAVVRHFERQGFAATATYLLSDALSTIDASVLQGMPFHAIVTDLQLPDGDGRDLIRVAREKLPRCPIVMVTGSRSVSGAVEALRLGALTVLEKPIALDALEKELRGALHHRDQLDEGLHGIRDAGLVGRSAAIRAILDSLLLAAPTDATILIEGETGTGKELLATAVHRLSRRSSKPFVAVNCAALPEHLAESELFGHVKGAFTGADRAREGCFRKAAGGTLFLDEIGEMPLPLQSKLLRTLQEGEVQPVGSDHREPVDVRIISATNRKLESEVAAKRFRADLYYRLNVVPLQVPPLRDRREDILPLVTHFLKGTGRQFTTDALAVLERYAWPGNVRELENLIQRLLVLRRGGPLEIGDLPSPLRSSSPVAATDMVPTSSPEQGIDLYAVLRDLEDRLIHEAL